MGYKPDADQLRFKVKSTSLPFPMENFTILFSNQNATSVDIQLVWEKTVVSFTVTADIDSKIMTGIDEAMKGEKKPYFQAAAYYSKQIKI